MRKLTYFIGATIDGYIAGTDGDFDFFAPYLTEDYVPVLMSEYSDALPTPARAAFGVADAPNKRFDTVLMGRGTYDPGLAVGLTSPYAHLRQIVFSRSLGTSPDPAVEVTAEDPLTVVRRLKQEDGLDIWLCGGADLAGQLLPEIDELIVKQYPVVAGSGIPLFRAEFTPRAFALTDSRIFERGNVVLTYAMAADRASTASG
ncbi:dihydrofolate reductase family protein [Kitasatospora aureofaciens]|uniref:dihydrofolate reductase family protein n=1 Tax=Kitasatospora aureofaciens TaxID=1894 RepID=UPI001C44F493|nr:dihydrofolate reductase family protein [Kitasatospora aureofaciens]MBV6697942.1 dihydrofolate reductase family protein [Kitasatospora aureofaciens]